MPLEKLLTSRIDSWKIMIETMFLALNVSKQRRPYSHYVVTLICWNHKSFQ
jgi:hypothetical protein